MRTKFEVALSRRRWRPADAEVVLSVLAQSGCTLEEFARIHGLHWKRLQKWQAKLGVATSLSQASTDAVDVTLLPVQVVGSRAVGRATPTRVADEGSLLDVSVGPGVIRVPHDFDEAHLRRVVDVLVSTC